MTEKNKKPPTKKNYTIKELRTLCNEFYSPREKCLQKMKNVFSSKEIYLFTTTPLKKHKGGWSVKTCINTCDGWENHYQAKIDNEDLSCIPDRFLSDNVLPPPAIAIKGNKIGLLVSDVKQYRMIEELFIENKGYQWGYIAMLSDELPTLYPQENKNLTI